MTTNYTWTLETTAPKLSIWLKTTYVGEVGYQVKIDLCNGVKSMGRSKGLEGLKCQKGLRPRIWALGGGLQGCLPPQAKKLTYRYTDPGIKTYNI